MNLPEKSDPLQKFEEWYSRVKDQGAERTPSACCLTSVGLDGYPNSRFVSLKSVTNGQWMITGSLTSRKGLEISMNPKVALTFWWASAGLQVRLQGKAFRMSPEKAAFYFSDRNTESQIVSRISKQGQHLADPHLLAKRLEEEKEKTAGEKILPPADWGGFAIEPIRMEFMIFRENRLHNRELYTQNGGAWTRQWLQP